MKTYYRTGALDMSTITALLNKAVGTVKERIRAEAAEGATKAVAPVARKEAAEGAKSVVTPMIIGVGALSALSLILAIRR